MSKLAIDGGPIACPDPFPLWPHYDEDEISAVTDVLRSGKVNQWTSTTIQEMEAAYAKAFGQPYAIALANGTLALELALFVAGIGPGDEVIVTPRSFMASASCVVTMGATPVFADIDPISQNITAETIRKVISPRTRAVIPVHLNGWPCDMPAIMALADEFNLYVIEDCAQSHGAMIDGKPAGSFGHAAALSFCQDKIITTGGEGGMTLFRDKADWDKAFSHKDHGKSYDAVFNRQHPPGFRWVHESFGSNWRLTAPQAAIGILQLKKLSGWTKRRREIASVYTELFSRYQGYSVPSPEPGRLEHAWYRFCFHVDASQLRDGWSREKLMAAINAEGVRCLEVCPEIYREKAFSSITYPEPDCPGAREAASRIVLLLLHPRLDEAAVAASVAAIDKVLDAASLRRDRGQAA